MSERLPHLDFTPADARRNIRWYVAFRVVFEFGLWYPTWVLLLTEDLGLSFTRIMVLDFLYQLAVAGLEVPTGMLADIIGRRRSLIGAAITMGGAILVLGFATDSWWVLGSFGLWAVGVTMLNGADGALVYESLHAAGRELEFPKFLGRFASITMIGSVFAMSIGGVLAQWGGLRAPLLAHAALMPLAVFAAFRLREPPRAQSVVPATAREILGGMTGLLRRSARFRLLIAFSAATFVVHILNIVFGQPLLRGRGLPVERLGLFFSGSMLLGAIGPLAFMTIRLRWSAGRAFAIAAVAATIACLGVGLLPGLWIMLPMATIQFVMSGIGPVIVEAMNAWAGAGNRATVLSLRSLVNALVAGPVEVVSGWYADRAPIGRTFIAAGLAFPIIASIIGIVWRRHRGLPAAETSADSPTTVRLAP